MKGVGVVQELVKLVDWVVLFVTVGSLPVVLITLGGCVSPKAVSYESTLKDHYTRYASPFGVDHPETEHKNGENAVDRAGKPAIGVDTAGQKSQE